MIQEQMSLNIYKKPRLVSLSRTGGAGVLAFLLELGYEPEFGHQAQAPGKQQMFMMKLVIWNEIL